MARRIVISDYTYGILEKLAALEKEHTSLLHVVYPGRSWGDAPGTLSLTAEYAIWAAARTREKEIAELRAMQERQQPTVVASSQLAVNLVHV